MKADHSCGRLCYRERCVLMGLQLHRWQGTAFLWAIALTSILICQAWGQAPKASDLTDLVTAFRSIDEYVIGNSVLIGQDDSALVDTSRRPWDPIPSQSRIVALEENSHFICATGDASHIIRTSQNRAGKRQRVTLVRRLLFLKPSVFVVDDVVTQAASGESLRWLLCCRREATTAGRQLCFTNGDQELVCETLWPAVGALEEAPAARQEEAVYRLETRPKAGANEVRWLYVLHLRKASADIVPVKSVLAKKDGQFELTITTADRRFSLSLPAPHVGAGQIAVHAADGKTIVPRRPLPSGVLPHGPVGSSLIERWDRAYRDGNRPPWDTGVPADDLKQAVEKGVIRPCRTAVLGCGSGTNAIYLASKGFDVTAIDIAPTALSIAQEKAKNAGVEVRWVLANVLELPEMEPFELIFDRGCYHNVRYVNATKFVEAVCQLSRPGTHFLLLSLNRDGPPGVREQHMRDDYSALFKFEWLRASDIRTDQKEESRRRSWSAMLVRKADDS